MVCWSGMPEGAPWVDATSRGPRDVAREYRLAQFGRSGPSAATSRGLSEPCVPPRLLFRNGPELLDRRVVQGVDEILSGSLVAWAHDIDPHPAGHIRDHPTRKGVATCPLNGNHPAV